MYSCSTLACSTLACSTLTYRTLACSTLACSTLACSTLAYSTLACSTLACSTLAYSTLAYSTLACSTLAYSTLAFSTLACRTVCCGGRSPDLEGRGWPARPVRRSTGVLINDFGGRSSVGTRRCMQRLPEWPRWSEETAERVEDDITRGRHGDSASAAA